MADFNFKKDTAKNHGIEKVSKTCANCYETFEVEEWRHKCPECGEFELVISDEDEYSV